jgi:hypothetical protein
LSGAELAEAIVCSALLCVLCVSVVISETKECQKVWAHRAKQAYEKRLTMTALPNNLSLSSQAAGHSLPAAASG